MSLLESSMPWGDTREARGGIRGTGRDWGGVPGLVRMGERPLG